MNGGRAQKFFFSDLTEYERTEILSYNQVYFLGSKAEKVTGSSERNNNGYDDESGNYKIIPKDHICYRYEILEYLGKGSFGQVVKCLDHKCNELVAIKIIKNKKMFYQQATTEAKLLRYIKINDVDNVSKIVKFYESFIFRHHFVLFFMNTIVS